MANKVPALYGETAGGGGVMPEVITPETLENPDFCPVSTSHKHKPDPDTLYLDYDGEGAYVDIRCTHCGRSGCVGQFDPEKVDW